MRIRFLLVALFIIRGALAQSFDPKIFSRLQFRFIGPDGNRMIAVAGELPVGCGKRKMAASPGIPYLMIRPTAPSVPLP
jgi:hypothetical protein